MRNAEKLNGVGDCPKGDQGHALPRVVCFLFGAMALTASNSVAGTISSLTREIDELYAKVRVSDNLAVEAKLGLGVRVAEAKEKVAALDARGKDLRRRAVADRAELDAAQSEWDRFRDEWRAALDAHNRIPPQRRAPFPNDKYKRKSRHT